MALSNFLGDSAEIKIVDFLIENNDQMFTMTDLAAYTGLSRTTLYEKIPKLILNGIVELGEKVGRSNRFQITDNDIINGLIQAVFANSFMIAEEPLEEEEKLNVIYSEIGRPDVDRSQLFDASLFTGDLELAIPMPMGGGAVYGGEQEDILTTSGGEGIIIIKNKEIII